MHTLIWASALQADILALALYLDQHPEHEVLVAATGVDAYLTQEIAVKRPFSCQLIERRDDEETRALVRAFGPDVTVVDNHFPAFRCSPALCKMWHGLGWKAPDPKHLENYHNQVKHLTGQGPELSNPRFMAMCYGPHDRSFRINGMGIHAESCQMVGMPFADLITNPPYTRADLASRYQIDIVGQKTVLVNFTWHYGSITEQAQAKQGFLKRLFCGAPKTNNNEPNQDDAIFLGQLSQSIIDHGANVLFCMHDRSRYEPAYLRIFADLDQRFGRQIQVKFKDEHPDNLSDLLVSDVMVSNLSSFITFFYHTGRPTVHLSPIQKDQQKVSFARASRKGVRYKSWGRQEAFMTEPDDNGGLTAYNRDECIQMVLQALEDPNCCKERTAAFLTAKLPKHPVTSSCARYTKALEELHESAQAAGPISLEEH